MIILYDSIVETATITSSSEESGYEWEDALLDIRLPRVGRFTGDTSEWLKFAFTNLKKINYLAILGHNLNNGAAITLEGNNTDVWTSPSYSETIYTSNAANYYNSYIVGSQVFQDVTNSLSGVAPDDYLQNGTLDYDYFTSNPTNFQHMSIYESGTIDLKSENKLEWEASGDVEIQFRDSTDGSSWGSWTTAIDATTTSERAKVYRYAEFRVLFTSPTWGDTTSYFQILTSIVPDIITSSVTEGSYLYWRLTFEDPNNEDGYIEIGNIFLVDSLTMPGMNVSKIVSKSTNSTVTKNASGQLFANRRTQLNYAEITFSSAVESDRQNVKDFVDSVDITNPFVLLIWEDSLDVQPPIYCNLTELPVFTKETTDYVSWGFDMKIEECK